MFSPAPPTDEPYITAGFPAEMSNGQGVIVKRSGTGRMNQDVLTYIDFNKNLTVEIWAYRADDVDRIGAGPLTDFWRADLMFSPKSFADARKLDDKELFREVAANVAESLLRWPLGRVNPSQATSVRVGSFDAETFTMNLPHEWKLGSNWVEQGRKR